MEEEKAAAYYDELTRKGEGAARFKQGLGFSSANDNAAPSKSSAAFSSSLSNFVKASSPTQSSKLDKQTELQAIQSKLKKKSKDEPSRDSECHRNTRDSSRRRRHYRSTSREREARRYHRKQSRGRSRSRSRSRSRERHRGADRDRDNDRGRNSRGRSPEEYRSERGTNRDSGHDVGRKRKKKNHGADYSRLIHGYDKMTPSEKVKSRMKLQLEETAEKDTTRDMASGWERFEFNKDAPLDDEEVEAAEDDTKLVNHIGSSFRFSAIEARREDQIKADHDKAMFGTPAHALSASISSSSESESDNNQRQSIETSLAREDRGTSLMCDKVLAKQQGSWRDRARKV